MPPPSTLQTLTARRSICTRRPPCCRRLEPSASQPGARVVNGSCLRATLRLSAVRFDPLIRDGGAKREDLGHTEPSREPRARARPRALCVCVGLCVCGSLSRDSVSGEDRCTSALDTRTVRGKHKNEGQCMVSVYKQGKRGVHPMARVRASQGVSRAHTQSLRSQAYPNGCWSHSRWPRGFET